MNSVKKTTSVWGSNFLQELAKGLSKNPLRIIALFIVLIYGFTSLVTMFDGQITANERIPLIYFLIFFPILVLAIFTWLVCKHPGKLYGPSDYKNEENYICMQLIAAASAKHHDNKEDSFAIIEAVKASMNHRLHRKQAAIDQVLWVDDQPQNHIYIRQALEAIGLSFYLTGSIQEAIRILKNNKFAAIISDTRRTKGLRGGYVLLDALRHQGDKTPFFMYGVDKRLPLEQEEALARGAMGSTNYPKKLFELVTDSLIKRQ